MVLNVKIRQSDLRNNLQLQFRPFYLYISIIKWLRQNLFLNYFSQNYIKMKFILIVILCISNKYAFKDEL